MTVIYYNELLINIFITRTENQPINQSIIHSSPPSSLSDLQKLFSEQLQKHDKAVSLIRQNLSAQANILRALTDANAKYATVRRATSEALSRLVSNHLISLQHGPIEKCCLR